MHFCDSDTECGESYEVALVFALFILVVYIVNLYETRINAPRRKGGWNIALEGAKRAVESGQSEIHPMGWKKRLLCVQQGEHDSDFYIPPEGLTPGKRDKTEQPIIPISGEYEISYVPNSSTNNRGVGILSRTKMNIRFIPSNNNNLYNITGDGNRNVFHCKGKNQIELGGYNPISKLAWWKEVVDLEDTATKLTQQSSRVVVLSHGKIDFDKSSVFNGWYVAVEEEQGSYHMIEEGTYGKCRLCDEAEEIVENGLNFGMTDLIVRV